MPPYCSVLREGILYYTYTEFKKLSEGLQGNLHLDFLPFHALITLLYVLSFCSLKIVIIIFISEEFKTYKKLQK